MKEQLEKELLNSLQTVKEYVSKTAEFASEQAPIVVEELIRFNLWHSGVLVLFSVFVMLAVPFALLIATQRHYKEKGNEDIFIFNLFSLIPLVIGSLVVFSEIKTLIMCLTAPRLFVIEYLRGLM